MIKSLRINKSELFYTSKWDNQNLNEYYQHILNNLILFLTNNNVPYSVNFGCDEITKDINLDFQYEHTFIKNKDGEYYPVCQPMETLRLIRGEYHPIGSTLQYPTKWGRKKASLHLVGTKLRDAELELENLMNNYKSKNCVNYLCKTCCKSDNCYFHTHIQQQNKIKQK